MKNFWKKLPTPFLALAPMDDVTDHVFREIVYSVSRPDVCFTEFTSAEALCSDGHEKTIGRFKYSEKQRPIVAQIWGCTPEPMYHASRIASEMGFDGIDINMGCPGRTVTGMGSGAALIKTPELAGEMIQAVREGAGDIPVSVKTRIGFDRVVTEEWVSFLLQQHIFALTIHCRTAKERSKVPADWTQIKKAVEIRDRIAPDTILVGNGDITSYAQAIAACADTGADGVMIARGIFTNPWVFEKTVKRKARKRQEYIDLLKEHILLFDRTWGTRKHFDILKKFFKMYIRNFSGAQALRMRLMGASSAQEALALLEEM